MKLLIPTLFGLEGLVADELRYRGFSDVSAENGRVCFSGDFAEVARANLWCRMGERVLIVLDEFQAMSFEDLYQGTKAIDWSLWIGKTDAFPVKGYSLESTLHSVPDCQSIIKKAIVDHLCERYKLTWLEETGPSIQVQFSIMKDHVMIMLDTSGPGLHKRGYRANANAAPLRETLAAGLVDLAHVRKDTQLMDPMCGSGTILIEGAMKAANIAPGSLRRFACEKWSCFPEELFKAERRVAKEQRRPNADVSFSALGYDLDPACVQLTKENAQKAGVADFVRATVKDVHRLRLQKDRALTLVCNPPYGERLLERKEAEELYAVLGERLIPSANQSFYIITSDEAFEEHFGRTADRKRKLYNGMIKCYFYMYYK